ncbi:MAG: cbb3-type cytochrome c oxidase subunit I, partial [Acidobacteriota bacterium]
KADGKAANELHPPAMKLTPSQWATGRYFVVVAVLFLLQVLVGGAIAHYRVEPFAFYGLHLADILPYNLLRTWHLQLAIFWIATAWVGGGLFLAPMIGGREPKHQKFWVNILLGALAVVVFGSLAGEFLGINDKLGKLWFWLGDQGSEYLDLGRFWQYLLAAGLVLWLILMYRALKPAIKDNAKKHLSSLFLYAAVAIPLFYLPALFYGPHTNFTIIDNWRFWIIHLWVEGFFELFATVLVAIMFNKIGVVTAKTATRLVYLDAILYLGAGVIGTGHHWYFTGETTVNMALAACFSAMEIVPLTLLTLDAWDFIKLSRSKCAECGVDLAAGQKWAIYFLIAVGVWNFIGAGVFGFLINLPIVSYFEVGTTLTANHAHAAMFGVFGMLALAVLVFCLRSMQSDEAWKKTAKLVKIGFWGLNIGLALMVLLDLFPAGLLQLWDSISHGYWHARELTYLMSGTFHKLEWLRIVADLTFIIVGVVPMVLASLRSYRKRDVAHDLA